MAIVQANRIKQTATGSGQANLTLMAAEGGFRSFSAAMATGSKTYYCVLDGNGVDWEVGVGTLISATELSRDTVIDSSTSSGFVNSGSAGSPVKVNLSANNHTVFQAVPAQKVFSVDETGAIADPTPLRLSTILATVTAMTAQESLTSGEAVFCLGQSAAGDGKGGLFTWDPSDATAPDNVNTFRNANSAIGLHKRVRLQVQDSLVKELLEVDAGASAGAILRLFANPKSGAANDWVGALVDRAANAFRIVARWGQAAPKNFISLFTPGTTADRVELHEPVVIASRSDDTGFQGRSLAWLSGVSRLVFGAAGATREVPLTKGGYYVTVRGSVSDLRSLDAAAFAQSGDYARCMISGLASDFVWDPSSSATDDSAAVIRPSSGAAASGNGRWIRVSETPIDDAITDGVATRAPSQNAVFDALALKQDRNLTASFAFSSSSIVPSQIARRFKHFANAREDFGVRLWTNDSATSLRDNTAELQEAIDKLQAYEGALFIPPQDGADPGGRATFYLTGPLQQRGTGGLQGLSVAIIGLGSNERTVGLNIDLRTAGGGALFDRGVGLKLRDGSNAPLLSVHQDAGHNIMENLILDCNKAGQSGANDGIVFTDQVSNYRFGPLWKDLYILQAGGSGVYGGLNRAKALLDWVWVLYSGSSTKPAMDLRGYDWVLRNIGCGSNVGDGISVNGGSQFEIWGGATWMNGRSGLVVGPNTEELKVFGLHCDENGRHGAVVQAYTASSSRRATIALIGCQFSDNSNSTDNTYSDILLDASAAGVSIVGAGFQGALGSNRVKHCIEVGSGAKAMVANLLASRSGASQAFRTSFTNDEAALVGLQSETSYIHTTNGGANLRVRANGNTLAEFAETEAWLGGPQFGAALQLFRTANATSWLLGSGSTIDFPYLVAAGAGANVNLPMAPKGSGFLELRASDGAPRLRVDSTGVGFFGSTPIAKPSVTGSRGGNAALADLLTRLAALGLITDSTS